MVPNRPRLKNSRDRVLSWQSHSFLDLAHVVAFLYLQSMTVKYCDHYSQSRAVRLSRAKPWLASPSASSFPFMLLWQGTQRMVIFSMPSRRFSISPHCHTSLKDVNIEYKIQNLMAGYTSASNTLANPGRPSDSAVLCLSENTPPLITRTFFALSVKNVVS